MKSGAKTTPNNNAYPWTPIYSLSLSLRNLWMWFMKLAVARLLLVVIRITASLNAETTKPARNAEAGSLKHQINSPKKRSTD